jgi:proteic killer suppression protein
VIVGFKGQATEHIFNGLDTTDARNVPKTIWNVARRKLDMLNGATNLLDLRSPPGNHLEKLKGDREGQHSIRINDQFRICFKFDAGNASDVEIVDYH